MAVATAERLRSPVTIEPLLRSIKGFVNLDKNTKAIPWESIWDSGISDRVIFSTSGHCFKYEAALLYPVTYEQNEGVSLWRKQARRELLDHLHRNPQSRDVYRSLRQANMVIPLDLRETLSERLQRLLDNLMRGTDKLLKRANHE